MVEPLRGKRYTVIGIAVVIIGTILVIGFVVTLSHQIAQPIEQHKENIVNGLITVQNLNHQVYSFSAPSGSSSAKVEGRFEVSDGRAIRVVVLDQDGYTNYKNRHQFNYYFVSGEQTVGDISTDIPVGTTMYLVYDNNNSILTDKDVRTTVDLLYVR